MGITHFVFFSLLVMYGEGACSTACDFDPCASATCPFGYACQGTCECNFECVLLPSYAKCYGNSDCIPSPSECHPHNCINQAYRDQFNPSSPMVCTELFDMSAAYKPSDCLCANNHCYDRNLNTSCPSASRPLCVSSCGSDLVQEPDCIEGQWRCPDSWVAMSSCPSTTCWGSAPPNYICKDGQWVPPSGTDECYGATPSCVYACGDNMYQNAFCDSNVWTCPVNTFPLASCPSLQCFGPKPPNSYCLNGQWESVHVSGDSDSSSSHKVNFPWWWIAGLLFTCLLMSFCVAKARMRAHTPTNCASLDEDVFAVDTTEMSDLPPTTQEVPTHTPAPYMPMPVGVMPYPPQPYFYGAPAVPPSGAAIMQPIYFSGPMGFQPPAPPSENEEESSLYPHH